MIADNIHLGQLINELGKCNGRVTIVDPIYDEVREVTHFSASYNMEMFFACIDNEPSDMTIQDILAAPSEYDEIRYYGVYAFMNGGDDFRNAVPVTSCSIASDGRLILFV